MRHLIKIFGLCLLLSACSSGNLPNSTQKASQSSGPEATPQPTNPRISYSSSVNPLNDQKTQAVTIESENTILNSIGLSERAYLLVRCMGKDVDVYIRTQDYLGDNKSVQIRINEGTVYQAEWVISQDHATLFSPEPRSFIASILNANKVTIGWQPYSRVEQAAVFSLASLGGYIARLTSEGCFI